MRSIYTAIIHLREPAIPIVRNLVEPMIRRLQGVDQFTFEPSESLVTILFDRERAGLADLVRLIEDCGVSVTSVAQRCSGPAAA